ncbi:NAD(P)-binding protein [Gordonia otitidis]|uniref:NAD(P)-binding protein n=1 Tax=Gordonia otitidis TaxID=249058 RepID=UPI00235253B6|nr:NAD(P)-binding protein [Gordonia otitidis]
MSHNDGEHTSSDGGGHEDEPLRVDLCIVGAGVAGLNALAVATNYLDSTKRVALIDRRDGPGGMWRDTYPYVRLHQPYQLFTAGDIPWELRREPGCLANRQEVVDHLTHCRDVSADRVRLHEFYGATVEYHSESDDLVLVQLRDAHGAVHTIETPRLINAYGFNVTPNQPLPVSSSQVRSVSPDFVDLVGPEFTADGAPVWIVGSGKTALDTAYTIIARYPDREVNIVAGSGTFFNNRDQLFPNGFRRWWSGKPFTVVFTGAADMFDGWNDQDVRHDFRDQYTISPFPHARRYMTGNLSVVECDAVAAGLSTTVMEYFVDVDDRDGRPCMILRDGPDLEIEPGSWVINCTGYLLHDAPTYQPYVTPGGRVVTVGTTSTIFQFSTYGAYFLTHLAFLDRLESAPLYAVDLNALVQRAPDASLAVVCALSLYNFAVLAEQLPMSVFTSCGVDFNRWYPKPRQFTTSARFLASHRRKREHYRAVLDTAATRFDVGLGPVVGATATR